MLYITDEIIDKIIKEDVPYSDITTEMLGIGEENGTISFYTRSEGVIAGAGLAGKIFTKLGCEILSEVKDGEKLSTGSLILKAKGKAEALHTGWEYIRISFRYCNSLQGNGGHCSFSESKYNTCSYKEIYAAFKGACNSCISGRWCFCS